MRTIYSDVLCIGAGLAGERVALAAAMEGFHTICLSVVPPRRSHSSAAQGGMQAALGNAVMGKGKLNCDAEHAFAAEAAVFKARDAITKGPLEFSDDDFIVS